MYLILSHSLCIYMYVLSERWLIHLSGWLLHMSGGYSRLVLTSVGRTLMHSSVCMPCVYTLCSVVCSRWTYLNVKFGSLLHFYNCIIICLTGATKTKKYNST